MASSPGIAPVRRFRDVVELEKQSPKSPGLCRTHGVRGGMKIWLHRAWMTLRLSRSVCSPWKVAGQHWSSQSVTDVTLRCGFDLCAAPEDSLVVMLLEVMNDRCYTRLLPRDADGVVIDAGANIGVAAIGFLLHSPHLTVHTYEPHPKVRERLTANLNRSGEMARIRIFEEALSAKQGEAWLSARGQSMDSRLAGPISGGGLAVRTLGLDQVLARAEGRRIALLKLDIEGAEAPALESVGADAFSKVDRCAIEYHDDILPASRERCERRLREFGLRVWESPLGPGRGYLYGTRD